MPGYLYTWPGDRHTEFGHRLSPHMVTQDHCLLAMRVKSVLPGSGQSCSPRPSTHALGYFPSPFPRFPPRAGGESGGLGAG